MNVFFSVTSRFSGLASIVTAIMFGKIAAGAEPGAGSNVITIQRNKNEKSQSLFLPFASVRRDNGAGQWLPGIKKPSLILKISVTQV